MSAGLELINISEQFLRDPGILLYLSTVAFGMAFSPQIREMILRRDGYRSVESGRSHHLEAAHVDHSRKNVDYDTVENGKTLTRVEHYKDHFNRAGQNGLNSHQNNWALRSIWERLSIHDREELAQEGYPDPDGRHDYIEQYPFVAVAEAGV